MRTHTPTRSRDPRRTARRATGLAAGVLLMAGCATVDQKLGDQQWYQKSKEVSAKAYAVSSATASKAYSRMQKYAAERDVLKTFEDAGEHSEAAVLGILHKSGITAGGAHPGAAAGSSGAAHAGAAGGAGSKSHAAAPTAPLEVPEQYSGAMRWPLDAYVISSEYGERWGKIHKGMDMAADVGEPVYAIADGEVIYAGDGLRGYGNVVILRHDRKTTSLYAHNSELKVRQGDHVGQGTLIALLGSTGHSTGPHVHFEIREGDAAVNPRTILPKPKVAALISP